MPPASLAWLVWGLARVALPHRVLPARRARGAHARALARFLRFPRRRSATSRRSTSTATSRCRSPRGSLADRWGPRRLLGGWRCARRHSARSSSRSRPASHGRTRGASLIGASAGVAFVSMLKLATPLDAGRGVRARERPGALRRRASAPRSRARRCASRSMPSAGARDGGERGRHGDRGRGHLDRGARRSRRARLSRATTRPDAGGMNGRVDALRTLREVLVYRNTWLLLVRFPARSRGSCSRSRDCGACRSCRTHYGFSPRGERRLIASSMLVAWSFSSVAYGAALASASGGASRCSWAGRGRHGAVGGGGLRARACRARRCVALLAGVAVGRRRLRPHLRLREGVGAGAPRRERCPASPTWA